MDDRDDAEQLGLIGGEHGMNAGVETRLGSGVTAVVLANLDPPAGERVMLGLLEWIGDGTRPRRRVRTPRDRRPSLRCGTRVEVERAAR